MTILLAISGWGVGAWEDRFRRLAPDREIRVWTGDERLDDVRYAVVWRPPAGLLGRLPRLEAIFNLGAGVDAVLADPDLPPVPLVRIIDEGLTTRMTEYVVLHVLLHHRQMSAFRDLQAARTWRVLKQHPAAAVRVGIMGLGVLGEDAAKALARLGFRVAGWSRSAKTLPGIETFSGPDGLDPFLRRTDILVCLLPLTPETRGILDAGLFARLARDGVLPGPVLINAGRGGHQVEADILDALDDGTLSAASLDVFEHEPLDAASPLWVHPRVVITPHQAADSDPDDLVGSVLAGIDRHERGEALVGVVERTRGY